MTAIKLINELLRREGKKKQVDKAQMTETVGHLADIYFENTLKTSDALYLLGKNRAKKNKSRQNRAKKKAKR